MCALDGIQDFDEVKTHSLNTLVLGHVLLSISSVIKLCFTLHFEGEKKQKTIHETSRGL